jgi:hypothetical protein
LRREDVAGSSAEDDDVSQSDGTPVGLEGHYGSDYPFTPEFAAAMASERLAEAGDPPGSVLGALRANTDRLFPALADRR